MNQYNVFTLGISYIFIIVIYLDAIYLLRQFFLMKYKTSNTVTLVIIILDFYSRKVSKIITEKLKITFINSMVYITFVQYKNINYV